MSVSATDQPPPRGGDPPKLPPRGNIDFERERYEGLRVNLTPALVDLLAEQGLGLEFDPATGVFHLRSVEEAPKLTAKPDPGPEGSSVSAEELPEIWGDEIVVVGDPGDSGKGKPDTGQPREAPGDPKEPGSSSSKPPTSTSGDEAVSTWGPIDFAVAAAFRSGAAAVTWLFRQVAQDVAAAKLERLQHEVEDMLDSYRRALVDEMNRDWSGMPNGPFR